jgi:hypothetical protein
LTKENEELKQTIEQMQKGLQSQQLELEKQNVN